MSGRRAGGRIPSRFRIEHVSEFAYSSPVRRCTMSLCLQPLERARQRVLEFSLTSTPTGQLTTSTDLFGNHRHVLTLHRDHDHLQVVSTSVMEVESPPALPDRLPDGAWEEIRAWGNSPEWWDLTRPSALARPSPALDSFVRELGVAPGSDPLADVLALSIALNDIFTYMPGVTSVNSSIDHILETGHGVCQDYAHVLAAITRSWGIPTRYVSGYLYVLSGDSDGTRTVSGAATHAWAECLLPGVGWIGVDPTNRTVADDLYLSVAIGRDYGDVPPTKGVIEGGGDSRLEAAVRIIRLGGRPRLRLMIP